MRVSERRAVILERLVRDEHVSTSELSSELAVSSVTIRTDLKVLEQRGWLRRVHGGAVPASPVVETRHDARRSVDPAAKRAMARAARGLIEPGMVVILDVGTSTLALAELLATDASLADVTVVTNGLRIAAALEPALPRLEVYLTGGSLRAMQHSLVNPGVSDHLSLLNASLAFIGCDGIHPERGVTTTNYPEADVKESMRRACQRSVLLAAAPKIGEVAMVKVNEVAAFDTVITTGSVERSLSESLVELGLELLVATDDSTTPTGSENGHHDR